MRILHLTAFAALTSLAAACGDQSATAPRPLAAGAPLHQAAPAQGTGLTINLPDTLSALGNTVGINQALVTNVGGVVFNTVGQVVGVQVSGTLSGFDVSAPAVRDTGSFTGVLSIASSGTGQCSVVSLDLSNVTSSVLGLVNVNPGPANFTVKGSGAVGSLLCNLGSALNGLTSGLGNAVQGLTNALNNQIGG